MCFATRVPPSDEAVMRAVLPTPSMPSETCLPSSMTIQPSATANVRLSPWRLIMVTDFAATAAILP